MNYTTLSTGQQQPWEHEILLNLSSPDAIAHCTENSDLPALELEINRHADRIPSSRLIIVANRLPISLSITQNSQTHTTEVSSSASSGGLVSALRGVTAESLWVGWIGTSVNSNEESTVKPIIAESLMKQRCIPVFLSQSLVDRYYNGYCNSIIWPLFHYLSLSMESLVSSTTQFNAYREANQLFADAIIAVYRKGDTIWIQDYHLMLLPSLLRALIGPDVQIGFFLHTPWPSSEIFRILPDRKELLLGILCANLVGFHTLDYSRHFQSSCVRLLGACIKGNSISVPNHSLKSSLGTFPIGIDPQRFLNTLHSNRAIDHIARFHSQFKNRQILLSVDRLDYIKGIPHKLLAFEHFLNNNTSFAGKVVLLQIAVPSRTDVTDYQALKSQTHELVSRINGKYGTLESLPIHYLDQSIGFEEMVALYHCSDAIVISSLRDGMNLVAYEYVICQSEQDPGVLILSEFAGASQSLGAGAITINPWSVEELSDAIKLSLTMSHDERLARFHPVFKHVLDYTAQKWAEVYIETLEQEHYMQKQMLLQSPQFGLIEPTLIDNTLKTLILNQFSQSRRKLIICGIAGVLSSMPSSKNEKSDNSIDPRLLSSLRSLASRSDCILVIMSSYSCSVLDELIGDAISGLWIFAENGFFVKRGQRITEEKSINTPYHNWEPLQRMDLSWLPSVVQVFQYFEARTPKSYIKQGASSVSWHYNLSSSSLSDLTFATQQANDLVNHLVGGTLANTPTEVLHSSYTVHVRPLGICRTVALDRLLSEIAGPSTNTADSVQIDFVICLGNWLEIDADLFSALNAATVSHFSNISLDDAKIYSCAVGKKITNAKYYLEDCSAIVELFSEFKNICEL